MKYSIVENEPFWIDCSCGGRFGKFPGGLCEECGNTGEVAAEPMCSLYTLAHNLAIAAALCRAHEIGRLYGEDEDARYTGWAPGTGREAP